MLGNIHFLRPWGLFAFLPLLLITFAIVKKRLSNSSWQNICDKNLLPYLNISQKNKKYLLPIFLLFTSGCCMVIALAGPAWKKIEVPTYKQTQPRTILLDMSENMLEEDLSPNRLTRAKFKLHDLFTHKDKGQFALIAYTSEPFVVSPLTDDGQTIDSLLPALNPDIMPIQGNDLKQALITAQDLTLANGATQGDILVLTAKIPDKDAIKQARKLANQGIRVSLMPITANKSAHNFFSPLTQAGSGQLISYKNDNSDINTWLKLTNSKNSFQKNKLKNIPLMHDEGRLFILFALIFMLPFFRKSYLLRLNL